MNDTRTNGSAATDRHRAVLRGWEGAKEVKARCAHTDGQRPVKLVQRRPTTTPHFIQVDYDTLADSTMTDQEYRVYCAVLSAAWEVKGKRNPCTLALVEIAHRAGGKSKSRTRVALQSLVAKGFLTASLHDGQATVYRVVDPSRKRGGLESERGGGLESERGGGLESETLSREGEVEEHEVEKDPQTPQSGASRKITRRTSPRENGTNPRALGINSRALGTNPRAQGTNPRNGNPYCGFRDCDCYTKYMAVARHGQDWEANKKMRATHNADYWEKQIAEARGSSWAGYMHERE